MDRRPLLAGGREDTAQEREERQQPRRGDAVSVLVDVDNGDPSGVTPGGGTGSDTRCSFFSSLSFSAWSASAPTAASRGYARRSAAATALLRPLQRLRLLCGAGRGCCGLRSAFGLDDEDEDNGSGAIVTMSANTLRETGSSGNAQHGKDGRHAATPTSPHTGGSGRGSHTHRQYAPPRTRSSAARSVAGASGVSTSPTQSGRLLRDEGHMQRSDSLDDGSVAGSSTPPSSVSFHRHGDSDGGHLVMQRGVLMRVAADGTYVRVPELQACSGGGGRGQLAAAAAPSSSLRAGEDEGESRGTHAVAAVLHSLEALRQPLHTLEQLSATLAACAPHLPLRVEVETDLNSATAIPAAASPVETTTVDAAPATPPSLSAALLPAVPLCVHVLGPVQACPTAQALRTLEDVLLEDCDGSRLSLCALHCADLDLRRATAGEDGDEPRRPATAAVLRARSNPFLDLLGSPAVEVDVGAFAAAAAVPPVLVFVQHLVAARSAQLTTLHFTRCHVAPHDMGRALPLPLATVRRLRFEQCSLTPAHLDALVALARHQDVVSTTRHSRSFGVLEELQLSGAMTPECISGLLDYVEEQQEQQQQLLHGASGCIRSISLRQVHVPTTVVRAAREHPLVRANEGRIAVVGTHT
ncbi:hypothetical protein NESM_000155400 [Novymonas esmeraldas]|uniref:Uncharacterized protein n=1 Tax=Novymonas esmeraldas TaxID=1808958 RepID=A0AAW0F5L1_9TRYP